MPNDKENFKPNGQFAKGNKYAAKKGECRNPAGRPRNVSIREELKEYINSTEGKMVAEQLVKVCAKRALKGDFKFWKLLMEIIDGKIPERLEGADGDGSNLRKFYPSVVIKHTFSNIIHGDRGITLDLKHKNFLSFNP